MAQAVGASAYIQSVSADYTMTRFDTLVKVDASAADILVTLADATNLGGNSVVVVRAAGIINAITVQGGGGQTINGAATVAMPTALYASYAFTSDGENWYITQADVPAAAATVAAAAVVDSASQADVDDLTDMVGGIAVVLGLNLTTLQAVGRAIRKV